MARVLLRPLAAEDRAELLRLRRESMDFLAPWEPSPPGDVSPCGPRWFEGLLESSRRSENLRELLCRRSDGAILGMINVTGILRGPVSSGYLGYWIGAPHARQGYMREGLGLFLRRAFGAARLHRLEANIRPENEPSRRLVRRLGFHLEGYSPRYLKVAGRWRDHERWALLAEEWRGEWRRP